MIELLLGVENTKIHNNTLLTRQEFHGLEGEIPNPGLMKYFQCCHENVLRVQQRLKGDDWFSVN